VSGRLPPGWFLSSPLQSLCDNLTAGVSLLLLSLDYDGWDCLAECGLLLAGVVPGVFRSLRGCGAPHPCQVERRRNWASPLRSVYTATLASTRTSASGRGLRVRGHRRIWRRRTVSMAPHCSTNHTPATRGICDQSIEVNRMVQAGESQVSGEGRLAASGDLPRAQSRGTPD
jgi:hypothetical protein